MLNASSSSRLRPRNNISCFELLGGATTEGVEMSAKRHAFANVMTTAAFVLCTASTVVNAQQTQPPASPPAATTAADRDRDDTDFGWIGLSLLGLFFLAGLMGRQQRCWRENYNDEDLTQQLELTQRSLTELHKPDSRCADGQPTISPFIPRLAGPGA